MRTKKSRQYYIPITVGSFKNLIPFLGSLTVACPVITKGLMSTAKNIFNIYLTPIANNYHIGT